MPSDNNNDSDHDEDVPVSSPGGGGDDATSTSQPHPHLESGSDGDKDGDGRSGDEFVHQLVTSVMRVPEIAAHNRLTTYLAFVYTVLDDPDALDMVIEWGMSLQMVKDHFVVMRMLKVLWHCQVEEHQPILEERRKQESMVVWQRKVSHALASRPPYGSGSGAGSRLTQMGPPPLPTTSARQPSSSARQDATARARSRYAGARSAAGPSRPTTTRDRRPSPDSPTPSHPKRQRLP